MKVALIGAGGHGKVVCRVAQRAGHEVVGFFDDFAQGSVLGVPVLGPLRAGEPDWFYFVSLGDNRRRRAVFEQLLEWKLPLATLIDPSAVLDETVTVGEGTVVMAGVVVNVDTRIGRNCILNTGCSVDHDGVIEDHAHLCPGTHLAGTVRVGEAAMLGTGCSVIPGRRIGAGTVVGAGAAVVRDLPENVVATGVPARVR
ncbi:MAG: acetyltransferase [Vulcanimicrobiota bacterium]